MEETELTSSRKLLKVLAGLLATVLVVLFGISFFDARPPDDAHLIPTARSAHGGRSSAPAVAFQDMLIGIDQSALEVSGIRNMLESGVEGELWDAELVERAVAPNRQALSKIRDALENSRWHFPEIDPASRGSIVAGTRIPLRHAARLFLLESEIQVALGDRDRGLDDLIACLWLGKRASEGSTCMIHQVMAMAVASLAIQRAAAFLETETDRGRIKRLLNVLMETEPSDADMAEVWKWEYQFAKRWVLAAGDGKVPVSGFSPAFSGMGSTKKAWVEGLMRPVFKENMTLRKLMPLFEERISNASLPLAERINEVEDAMSASWTRFVTLNVAGTLITDASVSIASGIDDELARIQSVYRNEILEAALRLYELDRQTPPDALQELVPEYLPKIPADPIQGDLLVIPNARNGE